MTTTSEAAIRAARHTAGRHDGAVLVEFAAVLPFLLVVLLGIIDFGFLFKKEQIVTNAAREGARMAVLTGYMDADVIERVKAYLTAGGVTEVPSVSVDRVPPSCPAIPLPSGGSLSPVCVTVTVTHTFAYLGPIATLVGGSFGSVSLKGRAVMRTEVAAGS